MFIWKFFYAKMMKKHNVLAPQYAGFSVNDVIFLWKHASYTCEHMIHRFLPIIYLFSLRNISTIIFLTVFLTHFFHCVFLFPASWYVCTFDLFCVYCSRLNRIFASERLPLVTENFKSSVRLLMLISRPLLPPAG